MDINKGSAKQVVASGNGGVNRDHSERSHVHYHAPSNAPVLVLLVLILIFLVGGASAYLYNYDKQQNQPVNTTATEASQVNTKEYQAVFLTNGQIYFGKLTTITSSYIKLTNIYYLESQGSQGSSTSSTSSTNSSSGTSKVVLVKLGSEIHGPEDAMQIYRTQVMFWENLKPSGDVTQAIDKYQG